MPRLRRSDLSAAGVRRVRSGRGFSYRDQTGNTVTDAVLRERIAHLAIPPAWTDAWICPYPNGHIQATGVDAAGRRQYLYHPRWREQKDRLKFDRSLSLAESLPAARRQVTLDLRGPEPMKTRALAAAFRMLDTANLRVGSEQYAEANGSFGLCTLRGSHATVSGNDVVLEFPSKSGQEWSSAVSDPDLASVVRGLKRRGGRARLLAFRDDGGDWHPLTPADINDYVRERTGGDFTSKDFRTLAGTAAAAVSLARQGPARTKTGTARAVAQAMRDAADVCSATPRRSPARATSTHASSTSTTRVPRSILRARHPSSRSCATCCSPEYLRRDAGRRRIVIGNAVREQRSSPWPDSTT